MIRRLLERAPLRLLFYVCLDVVVGAVIYLISVGEAGLSPGQLAIRILTAMGLASAIIGGPDIMLYWQESGRRIAAEKERDAERDARIAAEQERDEVVKLRNKAFELRDNAVRERDQAAANASETQQQMQGQIDELRTQIERLQSQRSSRRSRRRRLRNNEQ